LAAAAGGRRRHPGAATRGSDGHPWRGYSLYAPPDKPYHHSDDELFWGAAEEVAVPLSLPICCGSTPAMGLPAHWGGPDTGIVGDTMAHGGIVATIGQRICGGVAARHPTRTYVRAECETGWLGHGLQRLHPATYRARGEASPDLTMAPRASFQRQFSATFDDDTIGVLTRHVIGVDNLIWGNDSPHHDSIWPHSPGSHRAHLRGCPRGGQSHDDVWQRHEAVRADAARGGRGVASPLHVCGPAGAILPFSVVAASTA